LCRSLVTGMENGTVRRGFETNMEQLAQ
jgi:hypothetical protein